MPELIPFVGIEAVNAAVFRGYKNDIVGAVGSGQVGQIERLGVYLSVDWDDEQEAETGGIYIAGCKGALVQILPSSGIVVVVGRHDTGSWRRRGLVATIPFPNSWVISAAAGQVCREGQDKEK